jgi:hypothetical protein
LLKVAKIRKTRFPESEVFLTAVCRSLGDLAQPEGIPFLEDIAGKEPHLGSKNFSLALRLEALQALILINRPGALHFMRSLKDEKNPQLQEALKQITQELHSVHS